MATTHSVPTVYVISDALGDTACDVVLAAAGQFRAHAFHIERLPHVDAVGPVERHLRARGADTGGAAVFHTIVDDGLRAELEDMLAHLAIPAVDLMGPALTTLSMLTGESPAGTPGTIHRTDQRYFRRIEAMEYVMAHDDGRGADDLGDADIVLLGVSRTSKTPLSMYLAYQGYRVANVPLAHGVEPPASIYEVDPMRLFGLISTADCIAEIRDRRLGGDLARAWASSYADPAAIQRELDESYALMRRLGCFIVRTTDKSIEESAAEIIGRLEAVRAARRKHGGNTSATASP